MSTRDSRLGIPSRISVVRRLMLAAFSRRLKPLNVTPQQYIALRLIEEGQGQPSTLAERLTIDRPAVSRLLRGMRDGGWIVSHRSASDARRDVVKLTPAGVAVFKSAERVWLRFRGQFEAPFSRAEIAELDRLLLKLETVLTQEL